MTDVLSILGLEKESMDSIENRLKTLVYWPVDFMGAEELAESGFYYKGTCEKTDTVICFSCEISLSDWKPGYSANEQHKKFNQLCSHLRQVNDDPVYPEYKLISARHQSFMDWDDNHKVSAESLYKAGFYYEGEDNLCCCYHCGKGFIILNEILNPMEIHKRYSPHCKFLTSAETHPDEEDLFNIFEPDADTELHEICAFAELSETFDIDINFSNLNVEDANKCCICYDKPKDVALSPCGHTFCSECVKNLNVCPTCRKKIDAKLKIFL